MPDGECTGGRVPVDSKFQKLMMWLSFSIVTEVCRTLTL